MWNCAANVSLETVLNSRLASPTRCVKICNYSSLREESDSTTKRTSGTAELEVVSLGERFLWTGSTGRGALFNHGTRVPSQQPLTENSFLFYNSLSFITEPRRSNSYGYKLHFPLASHHPGIASSLAAVLRDRHSFFSPGDPIPSSSSSPSSNGDREKCDSGVQMIANDEQFQTWGPSLVFPGRAVD